jgi:hypothetical protein
VAKTEKGGNLKWQLQEKEFFQGDGNKLKVPQLHFGCGKTNGNRNSTTDEIQLQSHAVQKHTKVMTAY